MSQLDSQTIQAIKTRFGFTTEIKFNHNYYKIPLQYKLLPTYLIGVSVCDFSQLPEDFVKVDSCYAGGYYELPKEGKCLLLTLFTEHIIWTTVRKWNHEKEDKYRSAIGQEVKIKVENL